MPRGKGAKAQGYQQLISTTGGDANSGNKPSTATFSSGSAGDWSPISQTSFAVRAPMQNHGMCSTPMTCISMLPSTSAFAASAFDANETDGQNTLEQQVRASALGTMKEYEDKKRKDCLENAKRAVETFNLRYG